MGESTLDYRIKELEAQLAMSKETYDLNLKTQKANDRQMIDGLNAENVRLERQLSNLDMAIGVLTEQRNGFEKQLAAAQVTIERLKAPISDTEWEANCSEYRDGVYEEAMQREYIDVLIAARLNPPVEAV